MRGAGLEETVEDDLGDAALVHVAALEEHFCGALTDPAGNDECSTACSRRLRGWGVDTHVNVRCSGVTAIHRSKRLDVALACSPGICAAQVRMRDNREFGGRCMPRGKP